MGKRYDSSRQKVDRENLYGLAEAIGLVKSFASTKFDETVDIAVRLGIDPRQPDQALRGTVDLPHGTGKSMRVIAFAEGEQAREALEAGAVKAGGDDLIAEINDGFLDFDAAVAVPQLMPKISRLGRVLGPRGLMPSPRTGTIAPELGPLVRAIQGGRIEYRTDRGGIIHAPVGKASFEEAQLQENVQSVLDALIRNRPSAAKGRYLRSVTISPTMGPGVKVDPSAFLTV